MILLECPNCGEAYNPETSPEGFCSFHCKRGEPVIDVGQLAPQFFDGDIAIGPLSPEVDLE